LWEEYQAQRELHKTLRQAKLVGLAINRTQQFDAVKAAARAKRAVIKMTLKGAGRRIAYAAVQSELRQGIAAVNARIREERRVLTSDTRQLSWVDWLQQEATNGRADALEALRVARGRGQATTISAPGTAPAPSLDGPSNPQEVLRIFYGPDPQRQYPGRLLPGHSTVFAWAERAGYQDLEDIEPITVAAYIEILQRWAAPPTVKQHMAAIRMLFSWLTEKGVLAMNPAREVKTERFLRAEGKTPAFVEGEVQKLLGD
jgi:hypothetical protein